MSPTAEPSFEQDRAITMRDEQPLFADRLARRVFRGLGALPPGLQRWLGGRPIRVDGQTLHPTAQLGLRILNRLIADTFETRPVAEGREEIRREAWIFGKPEALERVDDLTIDGPNGAIPARFYQPDRARAEGALVVYFHGGGWVLGGLDSADSVIRYLANRTGCSFLSVDYRLAPEHKFPAGLEDSLAAFDYAVDHAQEFGCDPRLVAVAGESAGGNISAVLSQITAKRARSDPQLPVPAFQMLLQPVTDLSRKHASYQLFRQGYFLTEAQMDWYKQHYLHTPEEALDPRASPLLAKSLDGLCPAYVAVSGFDPLRDEGEAYAHRLQEAGVQVTLRRFSAHTHGIINATGIGFVAQEMLLELSGALTALIAQAATRQGLATSSTSTGESPRTW